MRPPASGPALSVPLLTTGRWRHSLPSARVAALASALSAALLAGCTGEPPGGATPADPAPPRPPSAHLVHTVEVDLAPVSAQHERPGSLRLRRLVRIYSQEEGRITGFDLFEGDHVAAGALVASLDDSLLQAELDKGQASRDQRQLYVQRLESLAERRAASDDELARARTDLAVAEAELRLLQTRLAYTRIQAPFAGVITERLVEPGDFVTKNTHLLTLADPASLIAEAPVSELILPHIAVGDPVRIRIDALGATFDGEILRIHPTLSERDRQAPVEARFAAIPAGARAGQFIRLALTTSPVPRLMIPFRALRQDRDGAFVWTVDPGGQAARRAVETGLRLADRIEVLSGLDSGDQVIVRGFLGLAEGKAVEEVAGDPGNDRRR